MSNEKNEKKPESQTKGPALKPDQGDSIEAMVKVQSKQHLQGLKSEVANDNNVEAKKWEDGLSEVQKKALAELKSAKNSEERVKLFAKVADDIGLDPLISLVPELGDAGSSIVSGLYLLAEAKKADLGALTYLKIIGLQAADFAVGAIPVIGDAADYFFKANKWSTKSFEAKTEELVKKAREAGVPEEKIQMLHQSAEKWPQLAGKAVGLYGKYKKESGNIEPTQKQAA